MTGNAAGRLDAGIAYQQHGGAVLRVYARYNHRILVVGTRQCPFYAR